MAPSRKVEIVIAGDAGGALQSFDQVEGRAGGFGSKMAGVFGGVGKAAALMGAAIGAAGVGAAVALFKVGESFDEQYDKIRVGTGKTGEALDGLQQDFKNVLRSVPTDFDSAGTAITSLNQKLGLTGKPLESLSEQLINLSRITKTDVGENVESVTGLFNNWNIATGDQSATLDKLYRASQASGVSVTELASQLSANGAVLRATGSDFDDATALIASLGKVGIDTGAVMPALGKAMATAAKDGKDAGDLLNDTFDRIGNAPDETKAAGIAMEVFGAKAGPKLAQMLREGTLNTNALYDAITGGKDTINQAASDTADFSEKWQLFKNRVLVGLEPLATGVFNAVGHAMDTLGPVAEHVTSKLASAFDNLIHGNLAGLGVDIGTMFGFSEDSEQTSRIINGLETIKGAFTRAMDVVQRIASFVHDHLTPILVALGAILGGAVAFGIASAVVSFVGFVSSIGAAIAAAGGLLPALAVMLGPVGLVAIAIAGLAAAFIYAWTHSESFRDHVMAALDQVKATFASAFGAVQAIVEKVVAVLTDLWDRFGHTLLDKLRIALDAVVQILDGALKVLGGIFDLIKAVLTGKWGEAWDAIKKILSGVWEAMTGYLRLELDAISAIFEAAKAAISAAWSAIWHGIATIVTDVVIDPAKAAFDGLVGFVTGLPGRIATAASGMWDGVKDAFRSAINWIITKWNNLKFPSATFHIPHVPGTNIGGDITIGGWNLPDIPLLAAGGIVTSPTLAVLGEAGPEAVIPLGRGGTTARARSALRPGDAGTPITIEIHGNVYGVDDLEQAFLAAFRRASSPLRQQVRAA